MLKFDHCLKYVLRQSAESEVSYSEIRFLPLHPFVLALPCLPCLLFHPAVHSVRYDPMTVRAIRIKHKMMEIAVQYA